MERNDSDAEQIISAIVQDMLNIITLITIAFEKIASDYHTPEKERKNNNGDTDNYVSTF